MSSLTLARLASRTIRSQRRPRPGHSLAGALKGAPTGFTCTSGFSSSARMESGKGAMGHEDETFEEFTARYDRYGMGRERKLQNANPSSRFFGAKVGGKTLQELNWLTRASWCLQIWKGVWYGAGCLRITGLFPLAPPPWSRSFHQLISPFKRNLNNAFAYDLVPSPSVVAAALKAARRVNDYPTAVRVFEGNCLLPCWPFIWRSSGCIQMS